MATRTIREITIQLDADELVERVEIQGLITNPDVANPQLDFTKTRGLIVPASELTAGQLTAVQDFADSVGRVLANTRDPIA